MLIFVWARQGEEGEIDLIRFIVNMLEKPRRCSLLYVKVVISYTCILLHRCVHGILKYHIIYIYISFRKNKTIPYFVECFIIPNDNSLKEIATSKNTSFYQVSFYNIWYIIFCDEEAAQCVEMVI